MNQPFPLECCAINFEPKHVLVGYAKSASNSLPIKAATFFGEIV